MRGEGYCPAPTPARCPALCVWLSSVPHSGWPPHTPTHTHPHSTPSMVLWRHCVPPCMYRRSHPRSSQLLVPRTCKAAVAVVHATHSQYGAVPCSERLCCTRALSRSRSCRPSAHVRCLGATEERSGSRHSQPSVAGTGTCSAPQHTGSTPTHAPCSSYPPCLHSNVSPTVPRACLASAPQLKFFDNVSEATDQIEVATRQYDRVMSPVDEGNVAVRDLGVCRACLGLCVLHGFNI